MPLGVDVIIPDAGDLDRGSPSIGKDLHSLQNVGIPGVTARDADAARGRSGAPVWRGCRKRQSTIRVAGGP